MKNFIIANAGGLDSNVTRDYNSIARIKKCLGVRAARILILHFKDSALHVRNANTCAMKRYVVFSIMNHPLLP